MPHTTGTPEQPKTAPLVVAAVDLGSNSFHMMIARFIGQDMQVIDRVRDPVCLACGLDARHRLSDKIQQRAVDCLQRFGQRLSHFRPEHVRAVGTNTLRAAANADAVRARFEQALGHPIEVVPGVEEARLIYLGVTHSHFSADPRLVIDIGGGSTEVIVGEGFEVLRSHSLYMGCVSWSRRFFPGGRLTREAFREAEVSAALELRAIRGPLRELGWQDCVGASGTIGTIAELLQANGWDGPAITLPGLKRLRKALVQAGQVNKLTLPGLREDRAPVLAGGLAILIALFKSLGIEAMSRTSGALREGLLYDLVGRIRHEDVRDRTIRRLMRQYHVDVEQAGRVERTATALLRQIPAAALVDGGQTVRLLGWAARLHEIGLAISYAGYHRHGAYLVTYSDMPGFSADDCALLAALIRGHRRKLPRGLFAALPAPRRALAAHVCLLLRLAVLLNRSRVHGLAPRLEVAGDWSTAKLVFPEGWLTAHPLTHADLEQEARDLRVLGVRLDVTEARAAAGDSPRAIT